MEKRPQYLQQIEQAFEIHPIVAILGPRQCGKTTLAHLFEKQEKKRPFHHFDLENPIDLNRLENPMLMLKELEGIIVIDEIQLRPDLFPILRVLVDQNPKQSFLILGSASGELLRQSSESLAGRIQYIELTPFNYTEVDHFSKLWLRGGFPRSYLAETNEMSFQWRDAYITTFLEKDIPNLGLRVPPRTLRRFWMMLAHYHGNLFNASEIGTSLGVAHTTARHYLDILSGTFMVRELTPWLENIGKRQIKSPKIYFRDSGIFHSLMGITDQAALRKHPKLGASWEGVALEEVIRFHNATPAEVYFWGVHSQGELDLLIVQRGKRLGFEFKFSDAPKMTRSMELALNTLNLDSLTVITPGSDTYPLNSDVRVTGIESYLYQP